MQSHPTDRDDRKLVKTSTPGVYKRGDRYVVRFRVNGRERKRFARTLAEAREIRSQALVDRARGEWRETSKLTLADYAAGWLDGYQGRTSRGVRPTTVAGYRRCVEDPDRGLLAYFGASRVEAADGSITWTGGRRLASLAPPDVKAYAQSLRSAGLATQTIRNYLTPAKAMLADAFEDGLIRVDPAARVRVASPAGQLDEAGEDEQRVRALTEGELAALIAKVQPEYRLLVRLLTATGLRIGEALALRWSDVAWGSTPRVQVRRRWYRGTYAAPKSRYGRRDVPLPPRLAQDLWNERKRTGSDGTRLVFPGKDGEPLAQSSPYRAVQAAGKAAGVPWVGPHVLRHTCATMLFRFGASAKAVQLWLGHHSPAFTLATYVHLLPSDLPDASFMDALTTAADEPSAASEAATENLESRHAAPPFLSSGRQGGD